jgi:gliding motility-associated-like protein
MLMTLFSGQFALGQEAYNVCQNALELCPGVPISVNNIDANVTGCVNCEDDFNFCFAPENTIWFQITTNAVGGNIQIDFSNLVFEINPGQDNELQAVLVEAVTPCAANTFTQIGTCHFDETSNFALTAAGLLPNTTYYLIVDGDNTGAGITDPAECTFDLQISGPSVDRIPPTSSISTATPVACENDIVAYVATLADCPDTSDFSWFVNGVLVATTSEPAFQVTNLADGDIVSVSNTCYSICPALLQATAAPITIESVQVDAGNDITVPTGSTVQLNGTTNASSVSWSPPFLVSDTNALNPFATLDETTVFALTATQNGCSNTDYVTITVDELLEIPNSFSPNGDNLNDSWEIDGLELYPDNRMQIFTRWGQRVFQTSAYSKAKMWDGENHAEGVYYFVLDLNDDNGTQYKGTLTLIR